MKILGLELNYKLNGEPIRTSGVDYYRIIQPLEALRKHTDWEIEIRKEPFTETEKNWDDIARSHDLIFTNYNIDSDWAYVGLRVACLKHNTTLVIDIDDNIYEIDADNPVHERIHKGSEDYHRITSILKDVEYVTCTNHALLDKLIMFSDRNRDNTYVIDNAIGEIHTPTHTKKADTFNIFYHGSHTHWLDIHYPPFRNALVRLSKDYPQIRFTMMGLFSTKYMLDTPLQYTYVNGHADYRKFMESWKPAVAEADICVAPLKKSEFTICKSAVKYYEYSSQGKPTIASDVRPYKKAIIHGLTGYLASTEDEWYQFMRNLLFDKGLREKIGKNAKKYVESEKNIEKNWEIYQKLFQKWVKLRKVSENLKKTFKNP